MQFDELGLETGEPTEDGFDQRVGGIGRLGLDLDELGLLGAGGGSVSTVGDDVALLRKRPGSSLAYVQPLESRQAAATTATSRFIAAIPQFYE